VSPDASASIGRVRAVAWREWTELKRNRSVLASAIVLPVMFTAMAIGFLFIVKQTPPGGAVDAAKLPGGMALGSKNTQEAVAMVFANVGSMLFLLMPTTIPSIMAAHSIVGEKLTRTLEPLLASPVRTSEVVLGKLLMSVAVGLIPALVAFGIYAAAAPILLGSRLASIVITARLCATMLLVAPPLAVLAVCLGMMISSRVNDVQSAQNWAGILVLPVIGFTMSQVIGVVSLSAGALVAAALVLITVDAGAVMLCVNLFEREAILTRWR
jgi:ABC-2 type transport system permease protein